FPFVWMVGTSMKTDDEVTNTDWMPAIPTFVPRSPFVLSAPEVIKPMPVDAVIWKRVYDGLLGITRGAVVHELKAHPSDADVTFDAYCDAAAAVVMNKVVNRMPTKAWETGDEEVIAAYRPMITEQVITEALSDRLARFEIRGMVLRSLNADMYPISGAA